MNTQSILEQVKRTIAKVLWVEPETIGDDASYDDLQLDSLSRIEVLVELERHYKLDIPEDDYSEEDLVGQIQTVQQTVELVQKYLKNPEP